MLSSSFHLTSIMPFSMRTLRFSVAIPSMGENNVTMARGKCPLQVALNHHAGERLYTESDHHLGSSPHRLEHPDG